MTNKCMSIVTAVGLLMTLWLPALPALQGQERPRLPKRPPPVVALATGTGIDGTARIHLLVPEVETRMEKRRRSVERDGQVFHEEYVVTVPSVVGTRVEVRADDEGVQVLDLAGKPVEPERLPTLLKKETPVLVSTSGKVDPYYLQVVKEGTLVIVLPPDILPGPAPPAPAFRFPKKVPVPPPEKQQ